MPKRTGRYTLTLPTRPSIIGYAACVGKKESEGPLAAEFDIIFDDAHLGEDTWEKAESLLHKNAVERAIQKSGKNAKDIDLILAGDLLDQCIGTTFGLRSLGIPFAGLYGACSTMALSLAMAAIMTDSSAASLAVASTSSHFCSAEKQFRLPLEYGGQRPPSAQWTATAAGAAVVQGGSAQNNSPKIEAVTFGRIQDLGITDANNMGAAMAPAASSTICDFLKDTGTDLSSLDLILTGDLGAVGSKLLCELTKKDHGIDIAAIHADCGTMLYDIDAQDVNSGGSGCGCSACVLCSYVLRRLSEGEFKKVLFVGTGALMSPVSSLQGESIPGIAHAVLLCGSSSSERNS